MTASGEPTIAPCPAMSGDTSWARIFAPASMTKPPPEPSLIDRRRDHQRRVLGRVAGDRGLEAVAVDVRAGTFFGHDAVSRCRGGRRRARTEDRRLAPGLAQGRLSQRESAG